MRSKTAAQSDKMLDAAARLFGTQRFHEVRMEDIATEAEVGKGTIYRYFTDKEELFLALLTRSSQRLQDRARQQIAEEEGARARLTAIASSIVTFFDEQPHLFDLIQRAEVTGGPDFPWKNTRDEFMRMVLDVFAEGKVRGEFTIRDPEVAIQMFLSGLRGIIRFGKLPRPSDLAERIVDGFLNGSAERTLTAASCAVLPRR